MDPDRQSRAVIIRCRGHANVRGTHPKTIELTRDADISQRGTCILGVEAEYDASALLHLSGPLRIELRVGELTDELLATANPLYSPDDPLVIRRSERRQGGTFAFAATKGALDIRRDVIEALAQPGARLEVLVEPLPDAPRRHGGGVLYVVSLPIGNADDLSPRARRVLNTADRIAAEDTRVVAALLRTLGIDKPVVSYHDQNETGRVPALLDALRRGERLALVSDAGTPGLSDPGFEIISAAISAGAVVSPIPGPSAILAALTASGLPMAEFCFAGFLPRTKRARVGRLRELAARPVTVVAFESPHRILDCLDDVEAVYSDRAICAARELTKTNEELLRGSAGRIREVLEGRDRVLGEFTLVLPGQPSAGDEEVETPQWVDPLARSLLSDGVDPRAIRKALQTSLGWSRHRARDLLEETKRALRDDEE